MKLRCAALLALLIANNLSFAKEIKVAAKLKEPMPYAIKKLHNALGPSNSCTIVNLTESSDAKIIVLTSKEDAQEANLLNQYNEQKSPEGFRVDIIKNRYILSSSSSKGAMYGLLELADQVENGASIDELKAKEVTPRFPFRAIKFNLPYMAYRSDESIVQHSSTCSDIKFWEKYLDMMAADRFNVLSLWSLHLFPYMVIPQNYPEATQFNQMEMKEWKKLWTDIFRMAKERGMETYIVNWNIFTSPSFARAHNVASYSERPAHFGQGDTSKIVEQYTREIIKQVIDEYPDLTGLGITLGERMGGQTTEERRGWLERTIFAGMRDAHRKIKFIYRAPLSADKESGGSTSEENDLRTRQQIEKLSVEKPVWLEFKYNWSHGHSSPNLFIVHGGKLTDKYREPEPIDYKYIWTVRNEDFFIHRWGQPDFIRQFIANNGQSYVGGCFVGSEVFIPALDYTSKPNIDKPWNYSFERLWLWYSMWGRLLYDVNTGDNYFTDELSRMYKNNDGKEALQAWKLASKALLHFASYHQGNNDLSLYTEAYCSYQENKNINYFGLDKIASAKVLDTLRYINCEDFVKSGMKVKAGIISPLALADSLDYIHTESLKHIKNLSSKNIRIIERAELADIEAWAWYSKFFADELRAAVCLMQQKLKNENKKNEIITYLESGITDWKNYADATTKYNNRSFVFHTAGEYDWYGMIDFLKIQLSEMKNL